MPTDQACNLSLMAEQGALIRSQSGSGQSPNASNVVQANLRLLQRRERCDRRKLPPPGVDLPNGH
jgi:Arc/MetJ-type ribon-helix-helix transcriptional regulator